ncbi:MAG: hypothetical protein ACRD0F_08920 [Acidimicrobiales bacterium]
MSVLDGRPDARAKGFMAGIAVDAAGFVRWYEGERRGWGPAPVRSFEGEPAPSAACFELFGRAEGWAAPGEIGSAEALVAYLWRPSGANLGWLGPPGLTPRELEARLKSSGLPAPAAPMPVPTVGPEMLRFTFPAAALQPVLVALGARFPGGGWDVNWDDERGWVDAIPGLGADAVIEEVLSAGSGG